MRSFRIKMVNKRRTGWDYDDDEQDDDADDEPYAHLDVLPPHLLPDAVGSPTETLSRDGEVVCLVLQGVQVLASLRDLVDVLPHHIDGVIDLLLLRQHFFPPLYCIPFVYHPNREGVRRTACSAAVRWLPEVGPSWPGFDWEGM